jgi:hypothetical protein
MRMCLRTGRSVMCQAGENGRNNWKEVLFLIHVGK